MGAPAMQTVTIREQYGTVILNKCEMSKWDYAFQGPVIQEHFKSQLLNVGTPFWVIGFSHIW